MPKLTKSVIDQSIAKEKNYFVWDSEVKGFGCQILTGGKKTYVFYYHSPLTKKKAYVKIGCHGNMTVDLARVEAKKLSACVASGFDPREKKKEKLIEEKQSLLFSDFFEIFQDKYMTTAYKDKGRRNIGFANVHILPCFGQQKLREISSKDIKRFIDSLHHITTTANRCLALLSMIFKKAEDWEYLPPKSNPCPGISKYKENKKQRFLSRSELARLEEALNQQEKEQRASYCTVNAIRLLLYTGCRLSEILNLKWKDVHIKDHYVYLKDTKTAWKKILKRAAIKDFTIHDLRHSFASFAHRLPNCAF